MAALPNPPENLCFGCGPANPAGLHLAFERIEEGGTPKVIARFTPGDHQTGWPGLLHPGLHSFLLTEISYWAALTLSGRVHVYEGVASFEELRALRVGKEYTLVARTMATDDQGVMVEAHSRNHRAEVCGTFQQRFRRITRREIEKAGLTVPPYLLEDMDP